MGNSLMEIENTDTPARVMELVNDTLAEYGSGYRFRARDEHRTFTRYQLEHTEDGAPTMRVTQAELRELLNERDHLRKQVAELQEELGKKTDKSLYRTVGRFHAKFGHPIAHTPHVPEDAQVRFRLNLIAEEFSELLDAACAREYHWPKVMKRIREDLRTQIANMPIEVNLPEFVDAQVDLAWVNEGTALVMGVLLEPALREVERANMAKDPVYVAVKDAYHGDVNATHMPDPKAKPTKPEGWRPPDIAAVLVAQGWQR